MGYLQYKDRRYPEFSSWWNMEKEIKEEIPSSTLQMMFSFVKLFGLPSLVAGFLLYQFFVVYLPTHEEAMQKQIEQCTHTVHEMSKELQGIGFKIDEIRKALDRRKEDT